MGRFNPHYTPVSAVGLRGVLEQRLAEAPYAVFTERTRPIVA